MTENDYIEKFEEFFSALYTKHLLRAAALGKKSITIDFSELDRFDPDLADRLLENPAEMLSAAKAAISAIDLPGGSVELEPRFKNLPASHSIRIRNLRAEHIGKFISLDGVVRRATEVRPQVAEAIFQCPDCESKITVRQGERILKQPAGCECGRRAGFLLIDKRLFDARWIVIEEPFEIATGERPGEISVYLKDDLTTPQMQRKCDPGSRLRVNGIVRELRRFSRGRMRTQLEIFIEANYIEPTEIEWEEVLISKEDEAQIKRIAKDPNVYEKLTASIAPSIYGMDEIKAAITLQLFGGVPHILPDKTRIRGDIHILLLGDPSTAKSQLLKLISNIIPRGKYVAGRGTTAAGLTATVLKDEEFGGGWVLEAGAMVLCNKGLIAIDEFDKMSKEDQIAMHEALEQQSVSIAKASIVATLPAQVSVLAGSNPKFSRFDPYRPIAEQIDIPDTLLSRFDLKFALRDIPDKERDEKLATHILETRLKPSLAKPLFSPEFLRKWIAYARKHSKPQMTRAAAERLKAFYLDMRGMYTGEDVVAITLRQNEALMRLAEASAKIRLSDVVEVQDAERAIAIMRYSLQQLAYDFETGKFDIDRTEGVSASQRSKIHALLDIIDRLGRQLGKIIPKEDVLAVAEEEGIRGSEAEELLARLKREGLVFEPRPDHVQRI
jgi:replicative DNA helicase Mcm